jgi:hypothetical protein
MAGCQLEEAGDIAIQTSATPRRGSAALEVTPYRDMSALRAIDDLGNAKVAGDAERISFLTLQTPFPAEPRDHFEYHLIAGFVEILVIFDAAASPARDCLSGTANRAG